MRRKDGAILRPEQLRYLEAVAPARDELLLEMEKFAAENGHPIADNDVARLLSLIVRMKQPERVLEIGTNIGYSVVVAGRELGRGATFETIEIDPETLATARGFVERAELSCEVVFHEGAALDVLARLDRQFELVFIDCVKTEYEAYLDLLLPGLPEGAVIVFDNMLWGGEVAASSGDRSEEAVALDALNRRLMDDDRLDSVLIPMSDGIVISVRRT